MSDFRILAVLNDALLPDLLAGKSSKLRVPAAKPTEARP
jgi:hypothetical protein